MLPLSNLPCVQYENSAYWVRFRIRGKGRDMDMRDARMLFQNEVELNKPNQYGGWWFCCIRHSVCGEG